MEEQSEALRSLSTSEAQMKSLYDDVYRAKEMLQLDKTFLQKEVSDLVSKDHHNERIIDNQSLKISQLETKVLLSQYFQSLIDLIALGAHRPTRTHSTQK